MGKASTAVPDAASGGKTWFGHPRGLAVLFFTEMWERFSYYGMRGLLILYLTQHFLFSDERSAVMYGAYTALVFIMTMVGGSLADKYLGQRKAVTFGAILLVLGHFGMAFEGSGSKEILTYQGEDYQVTLTGRGGGSDVKQIIISDSGRSTISFGEGATEMRIDDPAAVGLPAVVSATEYTTRIEREQTYVYIMYLSLALIIAGVGYLKANISTIVGSLYDLKDTRRDSAFTLSTWASILAHSSPPSPAAISASFTDGNMVSASRASACCSASSCSSWGSRCLAGAPNRRTRRSCARGPSGR